MTKQSLATTVKLAFVSAAAALFSACTITPVKFVPIDTSARQADADMYRSPLSPEPAYQAPAQNGYGQPQPPVYGGQRVGQYPYVNAANEIVVGPNNMGNDVRISQHGFVVRNNGMGDEVLWLNHGWIPVSSVNVSTDKRTGYATALKVNGKDATRELLVQYFPTYQTRTGGVFSEFPVATFQTLQRMKDNIQGIRACLRTPLAMRTHPTCGL